VTILHLLVDIISGLFIVALFAGVAMGYLEIKTKVK